MTSAAYHHPTRREQAGALFDRLARVQAASGSVRSLVGAQDSSSSALAGALLALERDLELALRDAEALREQLTR
jgi:hypothetical protein